uniref:Uncharacterized protein n=1 Tax=Junco hyemalis TaxID=40217 RepID=A0A8C5JK14_JUNHY
AGCLSSLIPPFLPKVHLNTSGAPEWFCSRATSVLQFSCTHSINLYCSFSTSSCLQQESLPARFSGLCFLRKVTVYKIAISKTSTKRALAGS